MFGESGSQNIRAATWLDVNWKTHIHVCGFVPGLTGWQAADFANRSRGQSGHTVRVNPREDPLARRNLHIRRFGRADNASSGNTPDRRAYVSGHMNNVSDNACA
jgi:hypothetical protein